MTTASEEEQSTASAAAKSIATGQALFSRDRKAAIASDPRSGAVACPSSVRERSMRPIPMSARPAPE